MKDILKGFCSINKKGNRYPILENQSLVMSSPDIEAPCQYMVFPHVTEADYKAEQLMNTYLLFLQETDRSWISRTNYGPYSILYYGLAGEKGVRYLPDDFEKKLCEFQKEKELYVRDDPEMFLFHEADRQFCKLFGMKETTEDQDAILSIFQQKKGELYV